MSCTHTAGLEAYIYIYTVEQHQHFGVRFRDFQIFLSMSEKQHAQRIAKLFIKQCVTLAMQATTPCRLLQIHQFLSNFQELLKGVEELGYRRRTIHKTSTITSLI